MASRFLLLLLLGGVAMLAAVLAVALLVWAALRASSRPAPTLGAAADRARRHALVVDVLAWVLLVLALFGGFAAVSAQPLSLQQGLLLGLVPAVSGTLFALVHAAGDLTWPRPTGTVRRAPLVRRTVRDVAPTRLRRALWSWVGILTVGLVSAGLVADETARAFPRSGADWTSASGPFPGWFYGGPLLTAAAVVLLAAELTLLLVARRPVVADADPAWDLGLRRLSAHRVLRGTQAVLGLTTAGVLAVAGTAILNAAQGPVLNGITYPHAGLRVLGIALVISAFASLVAAATLTALPPEAGRSFPRLSQTPAAPVAAAGRQ